MVWSAVSVRSDWNGISQSGGKTSGSWQGVCYGGKFRRVVVQSSNLYKFIIEGFEQRRLDGIGRSREVFYEVYFFENLCV